MRRRKLLLGIGVGASIAVAGCADGAGPGDEDDESENGADDVGDDGTDGEDDADDETDEADDESQETDDDSEDDEETDDADEADDETDDADEADDETDDTDEADDDSEDDDSEVPAGLTIRDHELIEEEFWVWVEGIVVNETGEELASVEVTVEFYDDDGEVLSDATASTTGLDDGEEWAFEVMEEPDDVVDYDVAITDAVISERTPT